MTAPSSPPTDPQKSPSFALAHPWLTTWIALSAIGAAVQIVQALIGRREPRLANLRPPPSSPAPASPT